MTGNVYNDLNANGNLDPGEPGLQGWTVLLEDASGNVAATTTSDANGNYEFDNLFPGHVHRRRSSDARLDPDPAAQSRLLRVHDPERAERDRSELRQLLQLRADHRQRQRLQRLEGSGQKSPIDPNLSGWTVELLNNAGVVVATTLSNSHGNFTFSGVSVGTYEVEEIVQSGWVQTQPVSPPYYTFTSQSGVNVSGLFFGNHHVAAPAPNVVINNGPAGSAPSGPTGVAIGTVPPVVTTTSPTTKTPTVAINGKSVSSNAVTVIYSSSPPAQGCRDGVEHY